jgi:nucleotide-binding universal stress UspA family protein
MTAPRQIIVATDFSPASSAAVSVASRMAQVLKAKVTLLHIFQYVPQHRYQFPVEWMVEIIRRDVRTKMSEAKNLLVQSGIETEIVVLEDGIPAQQIISFTRGCDSPLLFMGTHAFGGMERFLLGSTAEEVMREAECPVITVGPHVAFGKETYASLRKILFATDFSENSLAAIPIMLVLQQACRAHLRVLHVLRDHVPPEEENKQFGLIRKALQGAESAEYITLHGTNISQAVVNEAERYPADLLVLGVRRASEAATHLAPKIAFQIIAAAPCAVLTVSS